MNAIIFFFFVQCEQLHPLLLLLLSLSSRLFRYVVVVVSFVSIFSIRIANVRTISIPSPIKIKKNYSFYRVFRLCMFRIPSTTTTISGLFRFPSVNPPFLKKSSTGEIITEKKKKTLLLLLKPLIFFFLWQQQQQRRCLLLHPLILLYSH